MFIKIYFEEKPLFLVDKDDEILKSFPEEKNLIKISDPSIESLKNFIKRLEQDQTANEGLIICSSWEATKSLLFSQFTIIFAGGGLVKNAEHALLLIFRRGKWDLPKGKLDENEHIAACAVREVQEETGLMDVNIEYKLAITYHTYKEKNSHILKETHWYVMKYNGSSLPIPQQEEQITKIDWVEKQNFPFYLNETYPIIRELIHQL